MPRVPDEGDSDIAKRKGELGSNPGPLYLIEICGTRSENACVKCEYHDGSNVVSVDGALSGVASVVLANVGELEGIACGLNISGDGGGVKGEVPFGNKALDCINQSILRY